MPFDVEMVKGRVDCRELARWLGLELSREGRCAAVWRGGDNREAVHVQESGWFDHVEKRGGDCIALAMAVKGWDFAKALEEVGRWSGTPAAPERAEVKPRLVKTYDYLDPTGKLVFQVCRLEPGKNGRRKDFKQRRPDPARRGQWIWNVRGVQTVLYRWPEWIESPWVILVEGEKDADTLAAWELPATTMPMGAGKWAPAYTEALAGKDVVILADNDEAGRAHADLVAWELAKAAKSLRRLTPSKLDKGDVTDWAEREGGGPALLLTMVKHAEQLDLPSLRASAKPGQPPPEPEPPGDGRAVTSAANGAQGGRPPFDIAEVANEFAAAETVSGWLRWRYYRGGWYRYGGRAYRPAQKADLVSEVMGFLRHRYPLKATTGVRTNLQENLLAWELAGIPSWRPQCCWLDRNFENAEGWLPMANRIVHVANAARRKAGERLPDAEVFHESTPALFTPFGLGYEYDEWAFCPRWMDYLEGVQPNPADRELLQMLCGLALIPETRFNVCFFLYGEGGTGKSVFLHVLCELVGRENICCVPLGDFGQRFATWPLTNHLLNVVGELPTETDRGDHLAAVEGMLKDICDGGLIPVEHKGEDRFEGRAVARCVFATNELPRFYDRSEGLWDRLRIVAFDRRFRGSTSENRNLRYEIVAEELPGVFQWALDGLGKLLQRQTFPEHSRGRELKEQHRAHCDPEGLFLSEHYEPAGQESYVESGILYKHYTEYAQENGFYRKSMGNFSKALERRFGARRGRTRDANQKQIRVFFGVRPLSAMPSDI